MSETMLALLGFATIIMIIVLLLKNVTVPAYRGCIPRRPCSFSRCCFSES